MKHAPFGRIEIPINLDYNVIRLAFLKSILYFLYFNIQQNQLSAVSTDAYVYQNGTNVFDWKTILLCFFGPFPRVQLWNPSLFLNIRVWTQNFFKEVETRKGGVIDLDVFHKSEQVKEDNIYGQSREVRLPNTIAHFCSRMVNLDCHGFNKT